VADSEHASISWRKSTASSETGCAEVAFVGESVLMRHSRDPSGPVLSFSLSEWAAFVVGMRSGEFDAPTIDKSLSTARIQPVSPAGISGRDSCDSGRAACRPLVSSTPYGCHDRDQHLALRQAQGEFPDCIVR
jgi:hypothetical protein